MFKKSYIMIGFFVIAGTAGVTYGALTLLAPSLVHAQPAGQGELTQDELQEDSIQPVKIASSDGESTSSATMAAMKNAAQESEKERHQPAAEEDSVNDAQAASPIEDSTAEAEARSHDSSPSLASESQFRANGCRTTGTSVLKHHEKQVNWKAFVEQSEGSQNDCVSSVQKKLNAYCVKHLEVDGIFGPRTKRAVLAYQSYMRSLDGLTVNGAAIYVDGIVGAQTFAVMQEFSASKPFLNCQ